MENLTVKLPVVYMAKVRNGRERNSRETWFGEFIDFEIRQVDPVNAPVAAEWVECDIDSKCAQSIIYVDGQLYEPDRKMYQREQETIDVFFSENALRLGHAPATGLFLNADQSNARNAYKEFMAGRLPFSLSDHKEYTDDTRNVAIAKAQAALDQLIIVDGKLWTKCQEPVLKLKVEHSRKCWITYSIEGSYSLDPEGQFFRLTEWEAMEDFGNILASAKEYNDRHVISEVEDLQVHIPEAFTAPVDWDALIGFTKKVVKGIKASVLDEGREATAYWHDANDQLKETVKTRSDADVDLLMTVTERLVNKLADSSTKNYTVLCAAMKDRIANRSVTTNAQNLEKR